MRIIMLLCKYIVVRNHFCEKECKFVNADILFSTLTVLFRLKTNNWRQGWKL